MHLLLLPHYRKRTRCACPPGCILFQTLLVLKSDHLRRDLRSTGCHGGNAAVARRAVHFTRDSGRVRWRGGDREEVGRLFVKVLPKRVHLIKIIKFIFGSWGCSPKKEPPAQCPSIKRIIKTAQARLGAAGARCLVQEAEGQGAWIRRPRVRPRRFRRA